MKTEEEIATHTVERTASLRLLKTTDLDAIVAGAVDGTVKVEDLKGAGDFMIEVTPNGRDATKAHVDVAGEDAGRAWLEGFLYCASLKKTGTRKPKAKPANGKPAPKGRARAAAK